MDIVVVGGGNLGHAVAVTVAGNCDSVGLLTRDCNGFGSTLAARLPSGNRIKADNVLFSNRPEELVPAADIVLLTVPSHAIADCLKSIQPFITASQLVGSVVASGGFFWIAREVLGEKPGLFAFQRVPFICRLVDRGSLVDIFGLKNELHMAQTGYLRTDPRCINMIDVFERSFQTKIALLDSYLDATVSNSNPILHTSRLYSLLGQDHLDNPLYFYRDWDFSSSDILLKCDDEIFRILDALPIDFPVFKSLMDHYGVDDAVGLTKKLSSIKAFSSIIFPLKRNEAGHGYGAEHVCLDRTNRYFEEDLSFGLVILRALAQIVEVETLSMDRIIFRLQEYLGVDYLSDKGILDGRDIARSGIPQNFGVTTMEELIHLR